MQRFKLPSHVEDRIVLKERNGSVSLEGTDTLVTPVTNYKDAMKLLAKGEKAKSFGATQLNARSSRAHTVITFHIERRVSAAAPVTVSKIHLVPYRLCSMFTVCGV